jgi:hypothetical protein
MEPRHSVHQQSPAESGLVFAGDSGKLLRLPLLPFERELIQQLGCTEEEYRRFATEAYRRARIRPAEYDHIPDIQNGPAVVVAGVALTTSAGALTAIGSVLVSLAVGLVLSGVSLLLAPKPRQPGQATSRQLADRTGSDRFSSTSGFDSLAELANYGDPVPIIFGQYTGRSGGILAAPRLVWSRAFSYGSQQGVKMLFVVGEQGLGEGIERPDINGIFLGNTALDVIYSHNFAFYWKRNSNTFNRVKAANLAYGTRGSQAAGDTQIDDDVFVTQTIEGQGQPGFCHVYTPSANVQFGAYSPIPNGTDYRVNWRLVPIPNVEDGNPDPKNQRLLARIKIAGNYGLWMPGKGETLRNELRRQGQKGVGRGYGRRMGINSLNGVGVTSGERQVRQAAVGDTATFTIASGELPENFYFIPGQEGGTQTADINSQITSSRRVADEMLQVGETVMIGRTVWVVESRAIPEWQGKEWQAITLRCVEIFGSGIGSSIGLISNRMITRGIYSDDLGATAADVETGASTGGLGLHAGAGFYPLLRVAFGLVRNTRECEVTEIGIRSQVWNRASGLCNFSGLPAVSAFREAEKEKVAIESGTMTLYLKRTSVWTIWLRPSGTDASGNEYTWASLGEQFCVTGESPQFQFNFIRITHPQLGRYEFKMVPKTGADVARHSPDDAVFWRLDGKTRTRISGSYSTAYGTFQVLTIGKLVTKKEIEFNEEMLADALVSDGSTASTVPLTVSLFSYIPDEESSLVTAKSVEFVAFLPDGVTQGRYVTTMWELFGEGSFLGQVRSVERSATLPNGSTIRIRFTGIVYGFFAPTHPYFPNAPAWEFQSITVVSSSGGFNYGQIFDMQYPVTSGNPKAAPYGLLTWGVRLRVTDTNVTTQPVGRRSAWEEELFGSAQLYPIGTKRIVPFSVTSVNGTGTIIGEGVVVLREGLVNFPNQTQAWSVKYTVDVQSMAGNWAIGTTMQATRTVSATNPFRTPGTTIGIILQVLSLQTVVLPPGFTAERAFEENSQINDISFYDSLLTKSNENSPEHEIVYVNESLSNPTAPPYTQMTLAGLALKASRNFTSLNQLRVWLPNGIPVRKFQPDAPSEIGPSNKFTDLVYHLLTDKTAGAGNVISPALIDTDSLPATSQFLKQYSLFFDGAIDQPTNIRQFISDLAPFFLCSFVIKNGQFAVTPAVPTAASGTISTTPVKIKQLFTSGNIIEDSFNVEYLSAEERKEFAAVMRYRKERRNQFPEEQTLVVRWADLPESSTLETFDMTQYCTSREHAFMVAKYFLSLRRRVTHTINFKTTPYGLSLAPGDYIRVITQANVYNAANNGVVSATGEITSVTPLADGRYRVFYWNANFDEPRTEEMTVASGKVVEPKFYSSVFTVEDANVSSNTYMIEQLTIGEDGLVDIAAAHFPTTNTFNSTLALDLLNDSLFRTEG